MCARRPKMHIPNTTLLPTLLLLLLLNPVTSHPAPTPQDPYLPPSLQCQNGPTCQRGMVLGCANGNLYCSMGSMVNIPVGKCSDCAGSICGKPSDAYPGDSTPKPNPTKARADTEVVVEERDKELVERQTFGSTCQAQWECACVSFDGKGYYTRGKGSQCPVMEGAYESCTEDGGFLCIFGCRSELLKGFTNAKCHALFPGTRAMCRSI